MKEFPQVTTEQLASLDCNQRILAVTVEFKGRKAGSVIKVPASASLSDPLAVTKAIDKRAAELAKDLGYVFEADQPRDSIMQFFGCDYLPEPLQKVCQPFRELAEQIHAKLPRNSERTVALRKLLEAQDAAIRAALAK